MSQATNFKSIHWTTPQGIAGFVNKKCFGILNAAGTHALWNNANGQPVTYNTLKTANLVAPHANGLATNGHHKWVKVFPSRVAAVNSVK